MSDDAVDIAAPWTIKSVPTQTRMAVIAAAKREGITVGQWLERRVAEWLADGSPTPVSNLGKPDLQDVAKLLDAARELATAAGVKVPPTMAREGLALARQQTRAALGKAPLAARPRALPAPE